MLEPIASAGFLSSLSIIHGPVNAQHVQIWLQKVELLPNFCNNFSQPAQPDSLQDKFDSWVVKPATSLFNSFRSNVARFCRSFNGTFKGG